MLANTPHYLSYNITQNSKITLQITAGSSAICMIHAYRRLKNFRLLKGEYKLLNALPSKILHVNGAVKRRREKIASLTLLRQTFI